MTLGILFLSIVCFLTSRANYVIFGDILSYIRYILPRVLNCPFKGYQNRWFFCIILRVKFVNTLISTRVFLLLTCTWFNIKTCLMFTFFFRYSAFHDKLGAAVTSYKSHNNSTEYVEALNKSFTDITKIISTWWVFSKRISRLLCARWTEKKPAKRVVQISAIFKRFFTLLLSFFAIGNKVGKRQIFVYCLNNQKDNPFTFYGKKTTNPVLKNPSFLRHETIQMG